MDVKVALIKGILTGVADLKDVFPNTDTQLSVARIIKGDPFTYADFTPEQIVGLQKPASDAAAEVLQTNAAVKVDEDGRKKSEQLRVQIESDRVNAESQRGNNETSRTLAENLRTEKEGERSIVETSRVNAEKARENAELNRDNAERSRNLAEDGRNLSEQNRDSNESNRINTESQREESERLRKSAEQARNASEQSRINNEQTRDASEEARIASENTRIEAEKSRVAAEQIRQTNTQSAIQKTKSQGDATELIGQNLNARTTALETGKADIIEGKVPLSQLPTSQMLVYGVIRNASDDTCRWTPYNESLLRIDPIWNSRQLALINDDLTTNYLLDRKTALKKADGTPSCLNGTDGQVMIVIPGSFYWMARTINGVEYRLMSEHYFEIDGVPADYRDKDILSGPSLSTLDQNTGKLASVYNEDVKFRGGVPASMDADSDLSGLGRNANFSRYSALVAANKRGSGWTIENYEMFSIIRNMIIIHNCCTDWWAPHVNDGGVYRGGSGTNWANHKTYEWLNQFNWSYGNPNKMLDGVKKYGIGDGFISKTWSDFIRGKVDKVLTNAIYCNECFQHRGADFWIGKQIKNDVTGVVATITGKDSNHQLSLDAHIFKEVGQRWRILGVEMTTDYLCCGGWDDLAGTHWQWISGINFAHRGPREEGGVSIPREREIWLLNPGATELDEGSTGYSLLGHLPINESWIKTMHDKWMMPELGGSGSGKRYACYFYAPTPPDNEVLWRACLVGGSWTNGRYCSPWFVLSTNAARTSNSRFGARSSAERPSTRHRKVE